MLAGCLSKFQSLAFLQNLRLVRFATGTSLGYQEKGGLHLKWNCLEGTKWIHTQDYVLCFWHRNVSLFAKTLLYKCLWINFWAQRTQVLMAVVRLGITKIAWWASFVWRSSQDLLPLSRASKLRLLWNKVLKWMVLGGEDFWRGELRSLKLTEQHPWKWLVRRC